MNVHFPLILALVAPLATGCVIDEKLGDDPSQTDGAEEGDGDAAGEDSKGSAAAGGDSDTGQDGGTTGAEPDGTAAGSTAAGDGDPCEQLCFVTCNGQWPDGPAACMETCRTQLQPSAAAPPECTPLSDQLLSCLNSADCDDDDACLDLIEEFDDQCGCWLSAGGDGASEDDGSQFCSMEWTCYGQSLEVWCEDGTCECRRDEQVENTCEVEATCDAGLLSDPSMVAQDCCGFEVPPGDTFPG